MRKWNSKRRLAIATALVLLIAACGGSQEPDGTTTTSAPPGGDSTTTTTAPPVLSEFDQLAARAAEEGEIVFLASTNVAESLGDVLRLFAETFGLNVVISAGGATEQGVRAVTERQQGVYSLDVALLGTSGMTVLLEADSYEELLPLLIVPDIHDRDLWFAPQFPFLSNDTERKYVSQFLLRVEPNLFRTFYNTQNVDPSELTSWADIASNERWHGRLVNMDLSTDEVAEAARGWLRLGPEFFEELYRDESRPTVFLSDQVRPIVDGLARGEWDLAFFAPDITADAIAAQAAGLPVALLRHTLEEGPTTDLTGHFGVLSNAPHPAAAQLFANWILSKEGQTAINDLMDPEIQAGVVALRKDVPQGNRLDEDWAVVIDPNFVYDFDEAAIRRARSEALEFLRSLFQELGIRPGS